jgi:hypothetical protein
LIHFYKNQHSTMTTEDMETDDNDVVKPAAAATAAADDMQTDDQDGVKPAAAATAAAVDMQTDDLDGVKPDAAASEAADMQTDDKDGVKPAAAPAPAAADIQTDEEDVKPAAAAAADIQTDEEDVKPAAAVAADMQTDDRDDVKPAAAPAPAPAPADIQTDEEDVKPATAVAADMQTDDKDDVEPAAASATTTTSGSMKRDSFNGVWMLDKSKETWSMRGYLETLHVNELAIQAHEKGELDHDTFHTISTDADCSEIKIVKRSRVNNDLVVELTIGEEKVEYLQPGDRPKNSLATTEDSLRTHLKIQSSLLTMNGMAHITDIKRLVQESDDVTVLVQELTIVNDQTKASKTTTRYFIPFNGSMEVEIL